MGKATKSERLQRYLNKFLTYEERNDPITHKRIHDAFWCGCQASRKVREQDRKKDRRAKEPAHGK